MRVLSLDTTTRRGSVALVEDDVVIDERPGDDTRSHAERLPAELLTLLDARGVALDSVDLFAVASGPGSFTGLRIGIATTQGLAFVCRRPVVAVSTLEALAQLATAEVPDGTIVGAWVDAQRGEIFSGLYRSTTARLFSPGRLEAIEPPSVAGPGATLARWREIVDPQTVIFTGDGAVKYAAAIREAAALPDRGPMVLDAPLLAAAIARIGSARARGGDAVGPAGVRPEYIRRPDAEIDREKRSGAPSRS